MVTDKVDDLLAVGRFARAQGDAGTDLFAEMGIGYAEHLYRADARFAKEHGFAAFSTTLLVSPYQNHAGLIEAGERAAKKYGVEYLYRDFRPGFREGQAKARELEMYMQKYCGCVFSEEDRYMKQIRRDLLRNDA